jgi:hypothetical protein
MAKSVANHIHVTNGFVMNSLESEYSVPKTAGRQVGTQKPRKTESGFSIGLSLIRLPMLQQAKCHVVIPVTSVVCNLSKRVLLHMLPQITLLVA